MKLFLICWFYVEIVYIVFWKFKCFFVFISIFIEEVFVKVKEVINVLKNVLGFESVYLGFFLLDVRVKGFDYGMGLFCSFI